MIDKSTFHPLNYIKKEEYSGSMSGMRYMLKRVKVCVKEAVEADPEKGTEAADAVYEDRILGTVWPEPLGIHATPEEEKIKEYFTLDTDGVEDAADWLNKMSFDYSDRWKAALDKGLL